MVSSLVSQPLEISRPPELNRAVLRFSSLGPLLFRQACRKALELPRSLTVGMVSANPSDVDLHLGAGGSASAHTGKPDFILGELLLSSSVEVDSMPTGFDRFVLASGRERASMIADIVAVFMSAMNRVQAN